MAGNLLLQLCWAHICCFLIDAAFQGNSPSSHSKSTSQSPWMLTELLVYIPRSKALFLWTNMWVFTGVLVVSLSLSLSYSLVSLLSHCYGYALWQVKWSDGKKLEDRFVETLKKYGYRGSYMSKEWLKQPAFIQSFASTSLVYISNLTDLPKIFLIDDVTIITEDTNQVFKSFSQPIHSSALYQS